MLAIERRQRIIEIIQKDRKVYVSVLSQLFDVTEETIRRDLEKLEIENMLTRTYGGAVLNQHTSEDLPFPTRKTTNSELKQKIALKAADLIEHGSSIMMDTSTTCLELLPLLHDKKDLTIITNSIKIPYDYSNSTMNIISTGGTLRASSLALVGPVAQSTLQNYYVDMTIMSCKGLSTTNGITESNEPESELKKKMVHQAKKVILLADHSKFNKTAFIKLFDFSAIDYLITDCEPTGNWLEFFKQHNIQAIY